MPPIYVVAGSMRSLTTGVLNALVGGGSFAPLYTPGRAEKMREQYDHHGYEHNAGQELYELDLCPECDAGGACGQESCAGTFRRDPDAYAGRLMKYVVGKNNRLIWKTERGERRQVRLISSRWVLPPAACGYKAIFLMREYEEARQSAGAMVSEDETVVAEFPFQSRAQFNAVVGGVATDAQHPGRNVDISYVAERALDAAHPYGDPLREFEVLELRGWPIDPAKCAAVIDPDKIRFRIEALDVGVPVRP